MVKPRDQITLAIEKIACCALFPRGRGVLMNTETHGEAKGSESRQREQGENVNKRFYCGFLGRNRRGMVSRFRSG